MNAGRERRSGTRWAWLPVVAALLVAAANAPVLAAPQAAMSDEPCPNGDECPPDWHRGASVTPDPPFPAVSVRNGTDRIVTVYLNDVAVASLTPGSVVDPLVLANPPALPWSVDVRTESGYVLAGVPFETGGDTSYRFPHSCGPIDIWSRQPVTSAGGFGGEPGDCGPPDFQSTSPPPRPSLAPPVVVTKPPPRTTTRIAPRAAAHRGRLSFKVWVPDRTFRVGQWIPIHARIANARNSALRLSCDFLIPILDIRGLFDPGKSWQGTAAAFKARVLTESSWLNGSAFRFMTPGEEPCSGDVAVPVSLPAHTTWDFDYAILPRYAPGLQPLPSGEASLEMSFVYESNEGWDSRRLPLTIPVAIDGFDVFPYPSPGQLIDSVIETPGFQEWLWTRGEPERWGNTFADLWNKQVNWGPFGWTTPLPSGVAQIGLFADSPPGGDATVSGQVFLDPFTAYSYGFWARCGNSRIADYLTFGPRGCP